MKNLINFAVFMIFCAEHFSEALLFGPKQICCPVVGCFTNGAPYNGLIPLPLPQCFGESTLLVRLFTRDNRGVGQTIRTTTIPSVFNGNRMTMFIVHGWLQGILTDWLFDLKDTILDANDYNVIIVQWDLGSKNLNYAQSASNTRSVGAYIGHVARNLIQNGGSQRSRLYCVGHSLGSHVCGHAGATEKFGRITGLDPAGPLFEDRDVSAGLNPNCADLVDVIHTDGKAKILSFPPLNLGTMGRRGHVDFYPNGGGCQPGCVLDCTIPNIFSLSLDQMQVGCSHVRAIDYFQASISNPCFTSQYYDCKDHKNLPGSCKFSSKPVQSMGFHASDYSTQGIFYVQTPKKSPFCIN